MRFGGFGVTHRAESGGELQDFGLETVERVFFASEHGVVGRGRGERSQVPLGRPSVFVVVETGGVAPLELPLCWTHFPLFQQSFFQLQHLLLSIQYPLILQQLVSQLLSFKLPGFSLPADFQSEFLQYLCFSVDGQEVTGFGLFTSLAFGRLVTEGSHFPLQVFHHCLRSLPLSDDLVQRVSQSNYVTGPQTMRRSGHTLQIRRLHEFELGSRHDLRPIPLHNCQFPVCPHNNGQKESFEHSLGVVESERTGCAACDHGFGCAQFLHSHRRCDRRVDHVEGAGTDLCAVYHCESGNSGGVSPAGVRATSL